MIYWIKSLIFVKALFVEFVLDFIRNLCKIVLGIQRKQFPSQAKRVIKIS